MPRTKQVAAKKSGKMSESKAVRDFIENLKGTQDNAKSDKINVLLQKMLEVKNEGVNEFFEKASIACALYHDVVIGGLKKQQQQQQQQQLQPSEPQVTNTKSASSLAVNERAKGKITDEGYDSNSEAFKMSTTTNATQATHTSVRFAEQTIDIELKSPNSTVTTSNNNNNTSSAFKTPIRNMSRNEALALGYITPKIKPNKPMAVLRHPRQGETVLSMVGSPLLVSTSVAEKKANINIPLENGTFLSIMPERGLRFSEIPVINDEAKTQLEQLQANLNAVLQKNHTQLHVVLEEDD